MPKARVLRGTLHAPGPAHCEQTVQCVDMFRQTGVHDIREFVRGDVLTIDDPAEFQGLVARGIVAAVPDETPVSEGRQGDFYTMNK